MSPEALMDPADYEMVGVIGRISSPIREAGTGESSTPKREAAARVRLEAKTASPSNATPK